MRCVQESAVQQRDNGEGWEAKEKVRSMHAQMKEKEVVQHV